METAVLAVTLIGFAGYGIFFWRIWLKMREIRWRIEDAYIAASETQSRGEDIHTITVETRDVLKEASRLKAAKDSPFADRDKIPVMPQGRYVPLARRRAQAEAESQGPATHDERVRANNTRAMEHAG